jgi:hypothetical protein
MPCKMRHSNELIGFRCPPANRVHKVQLQLHSAAQYNLQPALPLQHCLLWLGLL